MEKKDNNNQAPMELRSALILKEKVKSRVSPQWSESSLLIQANTYCSISENDKLNTSDMGINIIYEDPIKWPNNFLIRQSVLQSCRTRFSNYWLWKLHVSLHRWWAFIMLLNGKKVKGNGCYTVSQRGPCSVFLAFSFQNQNPIIRKNQLSVI